MLANDNNGSSLYSAEQEKNGQTIEFIKLLFMKTRALQKTIVTLEIIFSLIPFIKLIKVERILIICVGVLSRVVLAMNVFFRPSKKK